MLIPVALLAFLPGCQDENSQYIKLAPVAPEPDHPNESYTERRARTYRPSKKESGSRAATNQAPSGK